MNKKTDQIVELAKKLIAFRTVAGNDIEIADCFECIKKYFNVEIRSKKITIREYKKNGILSLVLANTAGLNHDIILNGHIDVVNAEEKMFTPVIRNGKLLGRGASDMKSQVAVLITVFKDLVNNNFKKSVALVLTSDEEIGGGNGIKYLVEKIGYRAKIAIIPDGGDNFNILEKQKGGFWIKFIAKGKVAHASRLWFGENAILKLTDLYQGLIQAFPPLKKSKLLYQDGISINLGKFNGGKSTNSVPEMAEMHLDIRFSEKTDRKKIIDVIKKLVRKHKVDFEIDPEVDMFEISPKNGYLVKYKNIAEKILGRKIKIIRETGGSDARFFSKYNIPAIITVPDCSDFHVSDEWVEIKSLGKFYEIIKKYIEEI